MTRDRSNDIPSTKIEYAHMKILLPTALRFRELAKELKTTQSDTLEILLLNYKEMKDLQNELKSIKQMIDDLNNIV